MSNKSNQLQNLNAFQKQTLNQISMSKIIGGLTEGVCTGGGIQLGGTNNGNYSGHPGYYQNFYSHWDSDVECSDGQTYFSNFRVEYSNWFMLS